MINVVPVNWTKTRWILICITIGHTQKIMRENSEFYP